MSDAIITAPITIVPVEGMDVELPEYGSAEAAGFDIRAMESCELLPRGRAAIRTGLRMWIAAGYEVQIRPRSGMAFKHGVTVLNAPGTVDSDFRGEVRVLLINHGMEPFMINTRDRIAQGVLARNVRAVFSKADTLPETERGEGGFGSTGKD